MGFVSGHTTTMALEGCRLIALSGGSADRLKQALLSSLVSLRFVELTMKHYSRAV